LQGKRLKKHFLLRKDIGLNATALNNRIQATDQQDTGHWLTGYRPLANRIQATDQQDTGHWPTGYRPLTNRIQATDQQDTGH